jgi:hypothetical protein
MQAYVFIARELVKEEASKIMGMPLQRKDN